MSLMSESGLLFDQISQSSGIPADFWITTDRSMVQEDIVDFIKTHQSSDKYTG